MLLLIDNYDSFVHNLARYFRRLGVTTHVLRNDVATVATVHELSPAAIVLSPGPCGPAEAGCALEVVRAFMDRVPLLGVCLGHQTIVAALGGRIIRAPHPMHGRTSSITHAGNGLFAGLPTPLTVGRYHSLVADEATLPAGLGVTARTSDGVIMAVQHDSHPVAGVQFHPESVLTEGGFRLLSNFLHMAGLPTAELPAFDSELRDIAATNERAWPSPVTF